jgi:hypothetical protein
MTDPFSIASATVGFVGFVLQVATTAADFIRDAKGFPEEFTKLAADTKEFATLVERLKPAIEVVETRYAQTNGINTTRTFSDTTNL